MLAKERGADEREVAEQGSRYEGRSVSFSCVYFTPTNAEKPTPKRLSASPVAYWLVLSQITIAPNASAITAPVAAPARNARVSLPVCTPVANPAIAATSIIPSAPRLTMPARSLTSRPRAASASAVPALSVDAIITASSFIAVPSISGAPTGAATRTAGAPAIRRRYCTSVSQASSAKSSSPWKTPVTDLGRPRRDCASSPPM